MSQFCYFQRTGFFALTTLQTVGMQIADFLATALIRGELHGTDAGAHLALLFTFAADVDICERLGKRSLLRSHPTGDGSHRTERAPHAWRIDKVQRYAHDGGHHDDCPEYSSDVAPHGQSSLAPAGLRELDAEHGEDKEHHEKPETERPDKLGDGTVGRIFRQQAVVHVSPGTHIPAPPAASPDAGQHRANHADECQQSDNRPEISDDDVGDDDPVER